MKQRPYEREFLRLIVEVQDYMKGASHELRGLPLEIGLNIAANQIIELINHHLKIARVKEEVENEQSIAYRKD